MSFQLYDEKGYVADLGTTTGLLDMASAVKERELPEVIRLLDEGFHDDVAELLWELLDIDDARLAALKEGLRKCVGEAVISDGIVDEDETEREDTDK